MTGSNRTFRIFVSSTFSDLKAERDALQKHVFPRLRELCAQHGARFQAIDLRWGVSEEAALDQQTMNICLGEINRCQRTSPRPNFIVLLGDRYGWMPPPPQIPAWEFVTLLEHIHQPEDLSLLREWYRLDENAVPAEYCLQPRFGSMEAYEVWQPLESRLQRILERAAILADLDPEQRIKYSTSATEQEIMNGALGVPGAEEHVFSFLRQINGLPQDSRARGYLDLDNNGSADQTAAQKLANLKYRLEARMPDNTYHYRASWLGNRINLEHLKQLCQDVYHCLSEVILEELTTLQSADPLEREIESHQNFGQERARLFVGRTELLGRIQAIPASPDQHPLAIWGQSGTGKSALMAKAFEQVCEENPNAELVQRFIGATPESSNGRALLESLCRQVSRIVGTDESTIPADYDELVRELPMRLSLIQPGQQLILFLDALDQLSDSDNARNLAWLPAKLPRGVRIIVSTLPGECKQALDKKLPRENIIELQTMATLEGEQLLDMLLADAQRSLQSNQKRHLLERFALNRLPLYLKLAFEEARHWKSYSEPRDLSADVHGIILDMYMRLSDQANHGEVLVSHTLGYLAAAKNGLTEDEILDLLSMDEAVYQDFISRAYHEPPQQRLPVVVWSRLFMDLEPYLAERSADGTTTIGFYHRQLGEAANAQFLSGSNRIERHRALAAYFASQPLRSKSRRSTSLNLRKLSELPFHHAKAYQWVEYVETLSDFDFLQNKIEALGPSALITDYDWYTSETNQPGAEDLLLIQDTLRLATQTLASDPNQLAGQLLGHLLGNEAAMIHSLVEQAGKWRGQTWLRPLSPSLTQPGGPQIRTLQGHSSPVNAVTITPDGRLALSGDTQGKLIVWDLNQGIQLHELYGHDSYITTVAITPDGRLAVSGSYDKSICVWDLERGVLAHTLKGHSISIFSLALSRDGRRVASCCRKTVRIWDLERGVELGRSGHKGNGFDITLDEGDGIAFCQSGKEILRFDLETGDKLRPVKVRKSRAYFKAITADGQIAVSENMGVAYAWDVNTGEEIGQLRGHQSSIQGLSITPDGRWMASASSDDTVRIWDIPARAEMRKFEHPDQVRCVYISPDGRYVISGSQDHTVRVFDTQRIDGKERITTHSDEVSDVAISGDGRLAASTGDDSIHIWDLKTASLMRTISSPGTNFTKIAFAGNDRILSGEWGDDPALTAWDVSTGRSITKLPGHRKGIWALAVSSDGRYALSSSRDLSFRFWDISRGEMRWEEQRWEGLRDDVMAAAFLPDCRRILLGFYDGSLQLWDAFTESELYRLDGHRMDKAEMSRFPGLAAFGHQTRSLMSALAITGDGQHAISASADQTARVWVVPTGWQEMIYREHTGVVRDVAVDPRGGWVVSASEDHTLQVWQLDNGELIAKFSGDSSFNSCAVAPDGMDIIAGDAAGRVHIFRLEHRETLGDEESESPTDTLAFDFEEELDVLPDQGRADEFEKLGIDAKQEGDLDLALEYFDQALALAPDDLSILDERTSVLLLQARFEEALAVIDYVLENNLATGDNLGYMQAAKGHAFAGLKEYEQALACYEKALKIVTNMGKIWYMQGYVLLEMGDAESALESLKRAIEIEDNEETGILIGFCFIQMGEHELAEQAFRRLLQAGSTDPLLFHGLGLALILLDRADEGCQWLERFLKTARDEHAHLIPQVEQILANYS